MSTTSTNINKAIEWVSGRSGALEQRIVALEKQSEKTAFSRQTTGQDNCSLMRVIFDNYLLSASDLSISPSPWETLPLANILRPDRSEIMMTKTDDDHIILGNFEQRKLVNSFALANHTLDARGTVKLELFSDLNSQGDVIYDSGDVLAKKRIPIGLLRVGIDRWGETYGNDLAAMTPLFFGLKMAKSFRITLKNKHHTLGYFSVGQVFIGLAFQPKYNFSYGYNVTWIDQVEHTRTEAGTLSTEGSTDKYRRISFSLNGLDDTDAVLSQREIRKVGQIKEFFISFYPDNKNPSLEIEGTLVGRFIEPVTRTHSAFNDHTSNITIEEV